MHRQKARKTAPRAGRWDAVRAWHSRNCLAGAVNDRFQQCREQFNSLLGQSFLDHSGITVHHIAAITNYLPKGGSRFVVKLDVLSYMLEAVFRRGILVQSAIENPIDLFVRVVLSEWSQAFAHARVGKEVRKLGYEAQPLRASCQQRVDADDRCLVSIDLILGSQCPLVLAEWQ